MIEVFKTNVNDEEQAKELLAKMRKKYPEYVANFDLEDCDRVLRVEPLNGQVNSDALITFLKDHAVSAEVLPDIIPQWTETI